MEVLDAQGVVDFLSSKKYPIPCEFSLQRIGNFHSHAIDGGKKFTIKASGKNENKILLDRLYQTVKKVAKRAARHKKDIEKISFYCCNYKKIESLQKQGYTEGLPLIYFDFVTKNDTVYFFDLYMQIEAPLYLPENLTDFSGNLMDFLK